MDILFKSLVGSVMLLFFLILLWILKVNRRKKFFISIFGVITLLITIIFISKIMESENQSQFTNSSEDNLYEMDFIEHWDDVLHLILSYDGLPRSSKIEGFQVDYTDSGDIRMMRYTITWKVQNKFMHANVNYHIDSGKCEIKTVPIPTEEWIQFDYLVPADDFFELMNNMDLQEIRTKENYDYYSISNMDLSNVNMSEALEVYSIENNKIVPYERDSSKVGYYIVTHGMRKINSSEYHGDSYKYFFVKR